MELKNALGPTRKEQVAEMMKPGPEGPIFMVNLLKFKPQAAYEDGRSTELTGREAYGIYAEGVFKLLEKFNGRLVFAADTTFLPVGEIDELWDEVAVVMYKSRSDLVEMSMSSEWQDLAVHRTAGLEGQLNIETVSPKEGSGAALMKALVEGA